MIRLIDPKLASFLLIPWPSNSQSCGLTFPGPLTNPVSGMSQWIQANATIFLTFKTALSLFSMLLETQTNDCVTKPMPQPAVLAWALSLGMGVGEHPVLSHLLLSKTKSRVPRPMQSAIPIKASYNHCFTTKPFQGISHCLVFHHVNEPSSQAKMWEDQEHRLQDIIDIIQLLK